MSEPQWFYSSLAQVTAAIVGFVGGFLLLRLLEVMRDWGSLLDKLQHRQSQWSHAESQERQYDQIHPPKIGPFTGERLRLTNDESQAWDDLYGTIQERSLATMPRELLFSLAAVTLIAILFSLGPLLFLDHPDLLERSLWLTSLALSLATVAATVVLAVRRAYRKLHGYELYPHTKARLEDYELWIEGMQEREQEKSHGP